MAKKPEPKSRAGPKQKKSGKEGATRKPKPVKSHLSVETVVDSDSEEERAAEGKNGDTSRSDDDNESEEEEEEQEEGEEELDGSVARKVTSAKKGSNGVKSGPSTSKDQHDGQGEKSGSASASASASDSDSDSDSDQNGTNTTKKPGKGVSKEESTDSKTVSQDWESSSVSDSTEESDEEGATKPPVTSTPPLSTKSPQVVEFVPPAGYKKVESSDKFPAVTEADLTDKLIWHLVLPAGLPVDKLERISLSDFKSGKPFLTMGSVSYIFSEEPQRGSTSSKAIMIADSDSIAYKSIAHHVDKTLHVKPFVELPDLTKKQDRPEVGSESAAVLTSKNALTSVKPQPKKLRMRYRPPGFGSERPGAIGVSSSSDSDGDVVTEDAGPAAPKGFRRPVQPASATKSRSEKRAVNGDASNDKSAPTTNGHRLKETPSKSGKKRKRHSEIVSAEKTDNSSITTPLPAGRTNDRKSNIMPPNNSPTATATAEGNGAEASNTPAAKKKRKDKKEKDRELPTSSMTLPSNEKEESIAPKPSEDIEMAELATPAAVTDHVNGVQSLETTTGKKKKKNKDKKEKGSQDVSSTPSKPAVPEKVESSVPKPSQHDDHTKLSTPAAATGQVNGIQSIDTTTGEKKKKKKNKDRKEKGNQDVSSTPSKAAAPGKVQSSVPEPSQQDDHTELATPAVGNGKTKSNDIPVTEDAKKDGEKKKSKKSKKSKEEESGQLQVPPPPTEPTCTKSPDPAAVEPSGDGKDNDNEARTQLATPAAATGKSGGLAAATAAAAAAAAVPSTPASAKLTAEEKAARRARRDERAKKRAAKEEKMKRKEEKMRKETGGPPPSSSQGV